MDNVDIGELAAAFRMFCGEDADAMLFAAAAITQRAWRNTEVEHAHAGDGLGRINDGEMFAANVTMFRLVHQYLRRAPTDWSALEREMVRPDRIIAGRTLADLLGELYDDWKHTAAGVFEYCADAEAQHGRDWLIATNAAIAPLSGVHNNFWGMPRWPATVDAFLAQFSSAATPIPVEQLRSALLEAPDTLDADVLAWCIDQGIGYVQP